MLGFISQPFYFGLISLSWIVSTSSHHSSNGFVVFPVLCNQCHAIHNISPILKSVSSAVIDLLNLFSNSTRSLAVADISSTVLSLKVTRRFIFIGYAVALVIVPLVGHVTLNVAISPVALENGLYCETRQTAVYAGFVLVTVPLVGVITTVAKVLNNG